MAAGLYRSDLGPHPDGLSNNYLKVVRSILCPERIISHIMAGDNWPVLVPPASRHGVEVRATDATGNDLDNIAVTKRFRLELHTHHTLVKVVSKHPDFFDGDCLRCEVEELSWTSYLVPLLLVTLLSRVNSESFAKGFRDT